KLRRALAGLKTKQQPIIIRKFPKSAAARYKLANQLLKREGVHTYRDRCKSGISVKLNNSMSTQGKKALAKLADKVHQFPSQSFYYRQEGGKPPMETRYIFNV